MSSCESCAAQTSADLPAAAELDLLESIDDLVEVKDEVSTVRDEQTTIAVEA